MALLGNVTSGDPIAPSWGNSIRDQTVQVTTSAARPGAPAEGMAIWETDTDRLMIYNGVAWRQAWNMPGGLAAAPAKPVANQALVAATLVDITSASVAFTAVANRYYRARLVCPDIFMATAGNQTFFLTDVANVQLASAFYAGLAANSNHPALVEAIITPAAGAYTVKGRVNPQNAATLNASATSPIILTVEDIGPNGAAA